jgi:hypothetical protein
MADGARLCGRIGCSSSWRSQRIPEFMNQHGWVFFASDHAVCHPSRELRRRSIVVTVRERPASPLAPVELREEFLP